MSEMPVVFSGNAAFLHRCAMSSAYSEMQPHPASSLTTTKRFVILTMQILYNKICRDIQHILQVHCIEENRFAKSVNISVAWSIS